MLVPPEVRDEFDQIMERVRCGERISTLETMRLRKDGSRVPVALTLSPIRGAGGGLIGTSVIARDRSERKRMDAEVSKGRARLRAILDTAVDAIISIDGHGIIQTINPATERIFGYTSAELIGQNVKMLMPPPYHEEHDGYLARYQQTGEKRIIGIGREVQARRKDGTVFAIDLAVSEVEAGALFTGIIREVSERKMMEKALRESERMAAIGSMARGIGHDLGNLLNGLNMAACLLDTCPLPPDGVEAVRSLRATTGYLADLSHGLQYAAMDALNPGASQTTRLVDWWPAAASLLKAASRPGIAIQFSIPPELPAVRIAPHQLTQIVSNLASNACHALDEKSPPTGGGVIQVQAMSGPNGNGVRIRVADNGKGMSREVLARAFEPLFTTRPGRGGTGLGLALIKRLVTEVGGEVSIESTPGAGTTVTVDLCAAQAVAEPCEAAAREPGVAISISDTRAAALLRLLLERSGMPVRPDNDPCLANTWVVDPAADANEVKRWQADRPHRRLVLFGRPDPSSAPVWEALQPLRIDNPDDLEALRATIGRLG
jgi:PAS domain S-box-containing protein